jgi:hypothetical protein
LLETWCTSGIDEFQLVGLFVTHQSLSQANQKSTKSQNEQIEQELERGTRRTNTEAWTQHNDSNFKGRRVRGGFGPPLPNSNLSFIT